MQRLVPVPAVLPPMQLPANASWEATDDATNAWLLATHVGDPNTVCDFDQAQPGLLELFGE